MGYSAGEQAAVVDLGRYSGVGPQSYPLEAWLYYPTPIVYNNYYGTGGLTITVTCWCSTDEGSTSTVYDVVYVILADSSGNTLWSSTLMANPTCYPYAGTTSFANVTISAPTQSSGASWAGTSFVVWFQYIEDGSDFTQFYLDEVSVKPSALNC